MQKITPCIWFNGNIAEAIQMYTTLFRDGRIVQSMPGENGDILLAVLNIAGLDLQLLNGGPGHPVTPAISFGVSCETTEELDALWNALADGGEVLMPLGPYPFARRYGWVKDRFDVSWQLFSDEGPQTITPYLMFVGDHFGQAENAIDLYTSAFPDSRVGDIFRDENGAVAYASLWLADQAFTVMENDEQHAFTFSDGFSFSIDCADQAEVDHYWSAFTANGGQPGPCGWLTDPFGVSWQVVPRRLPELLGDADRERAARAMQAMMQMSKIDIAAVEAAANAT